MASFSEVLSLALSDWISRLEPASWSVSSLAWAVSRVSFWSFSRRDFLRASISRAAASIPGLAFASVREHALRWIWQESPAFQVFRGTDWLPEPCRSCALKEVDFGGCRCQALALTGDPTATDPACELSPLHAAMFAVARTESASPPPAYVYRRPMREVPGLGSVRLEA